MERICAAAARNSVAVSLGYAERDGNTLYLAQAFIDQNGVIQMNRRKIKPTHMERTVFGDGSGSSLLNVVDCAGIGRVGMLCCWEHSQPLLKFHTHSLGEQIHVAAWPAQLQHEEGKGLWSTANEGVQMNHVSGEARIANSIRIAEFVGHVRHRRRMLCSSRMCNLDAARDRCNADSRGRSILCSRRWQLLHHPAGWQNHDGVHPR